MNMGRDDRGNNEKVVSQRQTQRNGKIHKQGLKKIKKTRGKIFSENISLIHKEHFSAKFN